MSDVFDFEDRFSDEERERNELLKSELEELEDDIAYANAPIIRVRVDGDDSTMIAGPNCDLTDAAISELEAAYRQRLHGEGPLAR